jgi:hypothetical protein
MKNYELWIMNYGLLRGANPARDNLSVEKEISLSNPTPSSRG